MDCTSAIRSLSVAQPGSSSSVEVGSSSMSPTLTMKSSGAGSSTSSGASISSGLSRDRESAWTCVVGLQIVSRLRVNVGYGC